METSLRSVSSARPPSLTPVNKAWTQGFFPGLLWLYLERERLLSGSLPWPYTVEDLESMAREWQAGFRQHARKAINHDQGFRFASSFGRDLKLTGEQSNKEVLVEAAESLWDRYDPKVSAAAQRRCGEARSSSRKSALVFSTCTSRFARPAHAPFARG